MVRSSAAVALAAAALTWAFSVSTARSSYTADAHFGKDGVSQFSLSDRRGESGYDLLNAMRTLRDGRIVVVGTSNIDQNQSRMFVARLSPQGRLDRKFGNGGIVFPDVATADSVTGDDVQIDSKGRLVVVGSAQYDAPDPDLDATSHTIAMRLQSNGAPDPTFGVAGLAQLEVASNGHNPDQRALLLRARDGVLIASQGEASKCFGFCVVRLNASGQVDPAFGSGGTANVNFGHDWLGLGSEAIAYDNAGNIVVAGRLVPKYPLRHATFGVARFNSSGSLDRRFGVRGRRVFRVKGSDSGAQNHITGMRLGPRGRIVVTGAFQPDFSREDGGDAIVASLRADGSMDRSFARGGVLRVSLSRGFSNDTAQDVMFGSASGLLVLVGTARGAGFLRLRRTGSVVRTASGGKVSYPRALQRCHGYRIRSQGQRILFGGASVSRSTGQDVCLASFTR